MDDILIYSKDLQSHINHLQTVLTVLQDNNLHAKLSKCAFGLQETIFAGHVVSKDGIKADPAKVKVLLAWPRPTNVQELRSFLGFVGYYKRLIKSIATTAVPLFKLLRKQLDKHGKPITAKKGPLATWGPAQTLAFEQLRQALISEEVVVPIRPGDPYWIETDASNIATGWNPVPRTQWCPSPSSLHISPTQGC